MLQRFLSLSLLTVAAVAVPVASASAANPAVAWSGGAVQVVGTSDAEAFTVGGDATTIVIHSATPFEPADDGVCATLGNDATCEFDFDPDAPHAPADVVFDLSGAGADSVDASGRGAAVQTVTASYANAPAALDYAGGTPAIASVNGDDDALTGVDRIVGTPFEDFMVGGPAAETLIAGDGDDRIDVSSAGGPGDVVDCGAGYDQVISRFWTDTQTGCEVVNGIDTTTPAVSGPPATPPGTSAPPPAAVPPPAPVLRLVDAPKLSGTSIDVKLSCVASCDGQVVRVQPPPAGGGGLPQEWSGIASNASSLQAQLALMAQGQVAEKVRRELTSEQRLLETLLNDRADSALQQAAVQQQQAIMEAVLAMAQAMLALAPDIKSGTQLAKLASGVKNAGSSARTPISGLKPIGGGASKGKATAAAAKRPSGRDFTKWLLIRTARALPSVHTKLKATSVAGVYRARLTAPSWLRATSRVLRHRRITSLPVRLALAGTTASVRLPLPR